MRVKNKTPARAVAILADNTAKQAPCAKAILASLGGNAEEVVPNE